MKKILIYGDSNVWGDNFYTKERIPDDKQWPNILSKKLGSNYLILQEGLPGRIAGNYEIEKPYKNGKDTFISIFRTSAPVDYVFIMLGTNDLQKKYNKSKDDIINDLLWYEDTIKKQFEDIDDRKKYFVNNSMPKIVYILPANFTDDFVFDKKSHDTRLEVIKYFKDNHNKEKYIILDDMPLFEDGIHLNYDGHKIVSDKVLEVINGKHI